MRTTTTLLVVIALSHACTSEPEAIEPVDDPAVEPGVKSDGDGTRVRGLGPELRLTNDPAFGSGSFGNARSVVAVGDAVHIIWFDERSKTGQEADANGDPNCFRCTKSAREIYTRRSLDRGRTWEPIVRLTQTAGTSEFPSIAVSGTFVHAVWYDTRDGNPEIYYKRSADGGATWGADQRLTQAGGLSAHPSLAASGAFVHVAWHDQRDGNSEIYYKRSTDSGATFDSDERVTLTTAGSVFPTIAANGDDVHLAWEEHADGNGEIYTRRSTNNGDVFSPSLRLTTNSAQSFSPSIAVADGHVHVIWHDNRAGRFGIFHKRSLDRGATWSTDAKVTSDNAIASWAQVATGTENDAVIAWSDERHGGRNIEIYVARSTDAGLSWSDTDSRVTFDENRSTDPSIAIVGGTAHVLWTDARDGFATGNYSGNYEMYFRDVVF